MGAVRIANTCFGLVLCAAVAAALPAQTFTTLQSFDNTDGASPYATLVQAANGTFYGTTQWGGVDGIGTVFGITPGGSLTALDSLVCYYLCGAGIGAAALVQATNGDFYGTTQWGGTGSRCLYGCGTIFKITPGGTLTTLHSFNVGDGNGPIGGLVQGTDGDLYGTTSSGGAYGLGTVFKISPTGTLTTLYSFCSQSGCIDGAAPIAGLIQASDGDFYGTNGADGAHGSGTIFKITARGKLTTLYSFCAQAECADGSYPASRLVQAADGDFYGTTLQGGTNPGGAPFGGGTAFKITPGGAFTTLYSFCSRKGCADGQYPSGISQATDGNFYGTTAGTTYKTTYGGDANEYGTIFKLSPGGTLTTLYNFCAQAACTDGQLPGAGLVQSTSGDFYGTTAGGGTNTTCGTQGCGTVFRLSVGLGPFVETQPTSGKAGMPIKILGTDLTGVSGVSFNGTPAAFTVLSPSLVKATVPSGATSGTVQVVTSHRTLSSNTAFRVAP
jgi:uncharacterized repeat protein (TIGR03803 family)